jgi:putative ABC transport system permease protein
VSVLERKLARDVWRLKGQVATIALVLACGIMAMLMMRSTYHSLLAARDSYYAEYRFGDVFARLERAPDGLATRLEEIEGVMVVYPRIVEDVMVPMPDDPDPITGRIVSVPDVGQPALNALYLRSGRMPAATAEEAVVLESFVEAHGLDIGDRIPAVIEGRLREIEIVGTALSPEYVLAMSGREPMPDKRRFAVLWMARSAIAPAFQMEGAFNDVVIKLEHGASLPVVLAAIDRELAPYGGYHAVGRDKQLSNAALQSELDQLRSLAVIIPAIFLAVAAFLVNVVVSRLVFLERTQIAVLKALGFTDRRIALHYLGLIALVVAIAGVLGVAAGIWSMRWMTNLYGDFYRFPTRLYDLSPSLIAITLGIGLGAAVAGALGAVRRVTRMQPAEAMRPPSPLVYRRSLAETLRLARFLGASAMIVVREIERRPLRFALSTCGIAMAVAIFLFGRFSWDSFDRLMSDRFVREHREDLTVTLRRARSITATYDLGAMPGVIAAEGVRSVPARMHFGARWRDITIQGLPAGGTLRTLLDGGTRPVVLPAQGVVVSSELASRLGIRGGDAADVEILEGAWEHRDLLVVGEIDEPFGMHAYARADWLAEWLREAPRVNAVMLAIEPGRADEVRARLKQLPEVLGVTSTQHTIDLYRAQTGESMFFFVLVLTVSAAAIAIGVVYNNARIALSLRGRDLATLRVLGFTRHEVAMILLGEIGAQVVLGIPLGLIGGTWGCEQFALAMRTEALRFPMYIAPATYAIAATIALVSGIASALLVRRKLGQLDLIGALKSSD